LYVVTGLRPYFLLATASESLLSEQFFS